MNMIIPALTAPSTAIIFIIELILGIGLGYFSAKIALYILALIGIILVGVLLNAWQAQISLGTTLSNLGLTWNQVAPVITALIVMLGITTVLPITLGFIIGVVIAVFR